METPSIRKIIDSNHRVYFIFKNNEIIHYSVNNSFLTRLFLKKEVIILSENSSSLEIVTIDHCFEKQIKLKIERV